MSTTIRDVAKKAGVSPATVSLVLNNRSGISDDTRLVVLEAVDALGYKIVHPVRPPKNAGSICFLKIARHGHIINRDHNAFISDYIDGIENEAREQGYGLEVRNYNTFDLSLILKDLSHSPVDGVIILATELNEEDIVPFGKISIPVVFIDACHPVHPFDFVDMDNEGAVYSIVRAFKDLGHTDIGMVTASLKTRNFLQREKYFAEAIQYFGLRTDRNWLYTVDSTYEQSSLDMEKQLKGKEGLPTAFFCVCDIIAFGCIKALKKSGLRIPGDISVVGFDDLPSSKISDPPLSSIKVSKTRIGRRAFQLLLRRLHANGELPYEKTFIGSSLVIRESLSARLENGE